MKLTLKILCVILFLISPTVFSQTAPLVKEVKNLNATQPTGEIDRTQWKKKSLDMTRTEQNCGGEESGNKSCWYIDDVVRDHLDMNPNSEKWKKDFGVKNSIELKPGTKLKDGRYIYVYRGSDNKFIVRHYDRKDDKDENGAICNNSSYRFSGNYRARNSQYLHVRHSQLNGGWDPVWCAGELRVTHGKIDRINNASGHFKPPEECVLEYVIPTFEAMKIILAPNYKAGNASHSSTLRSSCIKQP